jgi:hypothetical protein
MREGEKGNGAGFPAGDAPVGSDEGLSARRAEEADEGAALGKYVYCVIEAREEIDLGPIGIGEGGHHVYSVHHSDLAAVVSDTPLTLYDPTRQNVMAHELVNETVMRDHTVIPMSFGTIFRTEEDVVEFLRTTGKAFQEVLDKTRGTIELGLKILWNREEMVARLEKKDEEIAGLRKEISDAGQGSTYFARVQLGRLVENALEAEASQLVAEVYETLTPLAVASRSSKLIGDNMILNSAFLVAREREAEFDEAVKKLSRLHKGVLNFRYTGPWPPYNFVNIKLKLERVDA